MRKYSAGIYKIILSSLVIFSIGICFSIGNASIVDDVKNDTDWLSSYTTRVVGTADHDKSVEEFLGKVNAVPNVKVWTHKYNVVMPVTKKSVLTVNEEGLWKGEHAVYPIWPSAVRANTTTKEGIDGKLIYIGKATNKEIPAKTLRGEIAVMEMDSEEDWTSPANFGAKAIILLGSPTESQLDTHSHLKWIPIYMPRYYIPEGPLAEALRKGEIKNGHLFAEIKWQETIATNVYTLVKSKEPSISRQAIAITVPLDSMSVTPDYAAGADSAVDVATALNMMRYFAQNPPDRPIMFLFVDAFGMNMRGMREMLASLSTTPATRKKFIDQDKAVVEEYKGHYELAKKLVEEEDFLNKIKLDKYRELSSYIKDAVALEIVDIDLKMQPLRLKLYSLEKGEQYDKVNNMIQELAIKRSNFKDTEQKIVGENKLTDDLFKSVQFEIENYGKKAEDFGFAANPKLLAAEIWKRAEIRIHGQMKEAENRLSIQDERDKYRKEVLDELDINLIGQIDIADEKWTAFCKNLVDNKNASNVSGKIYKLLSQEAKTVVGEISKKDNTLRLAKPNEKISISELRRVVVKSLNEDVVSKEDFYEKAIFSKIGIGDEAESLLEKKSKGLTNKREINRLNRLLLEKSLTQFVDPASEIPIEFVIGLDISDAGVSVGPQTVGSYFRFSEIRNSESFLAWLDSLYKNEKDQVWANGIDRALNVFPITGIDSQESNYIGRLATITESCVSFGMPSVSFMTLDAMRRKVDTGNDRAENLDWKRLSPQVEVVVAMMKRMVKDAEFAPVPQADPKWTRIPGTIVDQAPGEPLPRLPMKGYLTTIVLGEVSANGRGTTRSWIEPTSGIRRLEFVFSGSDGQFFLDTNPSCVFYEQLRVHYMQSYLLDDEGEIIRTIDNRLEGRGVNLYVDVTVQDHTPLKGVVFNCQNFTVYGMYDPRFLMELPDTTIIDARRGSAPQRMNYSLDKSILNCLIEPGVVWYAIFRTGITANSMALLNMVDDKDMSIRQSMKGFKINEPMPDHTLYISSKDFYNLDNRRLSDYKRAGITSKAIEEIQNRTKTLLDDADEAIKENNGEKLINSTSGALANEVRAYGGIRDLANDVVRAAIFLLLALVPFSFAMERLLFASPKIYKQIAATVIIFLAMTAILWSFHPAFRISSQPLIIIMAFGIIFMSVLVISMVFFKFKSGLEELQSGMAESSGAKTSRLGLVSTAVFLGIANMRKRKLRTALTGITVMLITFSLLCFMSTSSYVGQKEFTIEATSPYTGVLVRQPNSRILAKATGNYIESLVGKENFIALRYWWINPWVRQWRIHVRNPQTGDQVSLVAALGLTEHEPKASNIDKVCKNWDQFVAKDGCYLPKELAQRLNAKPGDELVVAGTSLELIDIFDDKEFDEKVKLLDGETLCPTDYNALGDVERQNTIQGDWDIQLLSGEMMSGSGLEVNQNLPHLPSNSIIIVPAKIIKGLREWGSFRSVSIITKTVEEAKSIANELAKRFAFPIYYADNDKVRVIATTPLVPRPPKSLIIPLIIAGFIIFNTMLSSIAERKKEIYIYTSLGLAPLHVGVLFLSEAITYGLMGSIFGYVIGQGGATFFSKMGWMGAITLNYSGTQAIITMAMVIGIVIVSSLIPAYLAGKLAAPSNEMTWKVPEPKDGVIHDILPFTVTKSTANGAIEFLLDYFKAHREGGIGNFTTDNLTTYVKNEGGIDVLGIKSTVWLAPFDLAVRQDVEIKIAPTDEDDVLGIDIVLIRESGQTSNWKKLNHVFLGDLRKQLLGWRKLRPDRIMKYIKDGNIRLNKSKGMEG